MDTSERTRCIFWILKWYRELLPTEDNKVMGRKWLCFRDKHAVVAVALDCLRLYNHWTIIGKTYSPDTFLRQT